MELKKNPKADIGRNSGLYFVAGLAFVMLITWQALEYKKYDANEFLKLRLLILQTTSI